LEFGNSYRSSKWIIISKRSDEVCQIGQEIHTA
jgi:hypothetical protein